MSSLQQSMDGQTSDNNASEPASGGTINNGQAPRRPDHDVQVEEFLKDQYKSKSGKDMPELGEDMKD